MERTVAFSSGKAAEVPAEDSDRNNARRANGFHIFYFCNSAEKATVRSMLPAFNLWRPGS
jgi:hypothetical protein